MENNKENTPVIRNRLKETSLFLLDILYNALIIIALVFLIRGFLISPFLVVGSSMADTLEDNEFILVDKLSYLVGEIDRGDPIVFLPPAISGNPPKFETEINTDSKGYAKLDLNEFQGEKTSSYCQKKALNGIWLCKTQPEERDLIYFIPHENSPQVSQIETNREEIKKIILNKEDLEKGYIELNGKPQSNYSVKIYGSEGPEYFVKRVIGIPGDTVKIEDGKVYLKRPDDKDFKKIDEPFLNIKNNKRTYLDFPEKGNTFKVPEGHYFVLGDNRRWSSDSRRWLDPVTEESIPYVSEENIAGKVFVVLWPLTKMQFIESADF